MGKTKLLVVTVCSQFKSLFLFFYSGHALTLFHGKNIKVL